jgi:argininosuccinate lyase
MDRRWSAVSVADLTDPKSPSAVDDPTLGVGSRLAENPSPLLIGTAFADDLEAQRDLFDGLGLADLAHTLTMAENGVIPPASACDLVAWLLALGKRPADFVPAAHHGDLYTNREAWLTERTAAVGWLGVARARREALTTAFYILVREKLLDFASALAETGAVLAKLAVRHDQAVMADYTYLQAAQPTTFGHYVLGFAWPVVRDLERVGSLYARLDQCPAGCGSTNGSIITQDREALARRLGFAAPIRHARDGMWQIDLPIEGMSVLVAAAINLDRLAEDLMIFASAEFGLVRLADRHGRASKIMPQKRNPFALAYVRAVANRLIGAQATMAVSGRTPSGQMDNRVNVYGALPRAIADCTGAASLMAEVLDWLTFDSARARIALSDRSVCATDLAERLTLQGGIDFRTAHALVGRLVSRLEEQFRTLAGVTTADIAAVATEMTGLPIEVEAKLLAQAIDPIAGIAARNGLGGCAPEEVRAMVEDLNRNLARHRSWIDMTRDKQRQAINALLDEARTFARVSR